MSKVLCLNADLGELPGEEGRAIDAAMLEVVTRCNIACGGHAGDAATVRITMRRAQERDVQAGVHPSYPDRENFGRRSMQLSPAELRRTLDAQIHLFDKVAHTESMRIEHLKPHGALYNDAAKDLNIARVIASVAADWAIPEIIGPPNSALETATARAGLVFIPEGFADRSYEPDGSLTPRQFEGAVLEDTRSVLAQAVQFAARGVVSVRGGGAIALPIRTLCLHSDTPCAAEHARAIRAGLVEAGVTILA
jgi:UPF0271 protein